MQVSFTQREVSSSLTLVISIVRAFPKNVRRDTLDKLYEMEAALNSIVRTAKKAVEEDHVLDMIGDFNKRFSEDSKGVTAFLTTELELLVTYDPDVIVEILEAINREVPALTGMAFTAYGLMLSFGSSFKRIGESIKHSIKSRYEN